MSTCRATLALAAAATVGLAAGCTPTNAPQDRGTVEPVGGLGDDNQRDRESSFFDLFEDTDNPNVTLEVNKYIWTASMEVLDFMPIETADPFSGVLVMGYGVPPGGSRAYRATVYVQDPALDARALNVALQTRSGPAAPETVRAVEDAILTRARQLRIRDGAL